MNTFTPAVLVPLLMSGTAVYGCFRRVDVYQALADGAAEGLELMRKIAPPLVGLLTAVHMLRASGLVDRIAELLSPVLVRIGLPPELVGLMLLRPISGSAALGVGAELIGRFGPDSRIGRTAAVMLGSTETTFYTIAVYFGAAGISKSRCTVPAALFADLVGFLAAAWAVRLLFPGG